MKRQTPYAIAIFRKQLPPTCHVIPADPNAKTTLLFVVPSISRRERLAEAEPRSLLEDVSAVAAHVEEFLQPMSA